jgi:RNA polymerase sigma factor (sigma-70 family)
MDLGTHVDDAALVRAAQAGDGQAFGVLFDRWSTRVVDVAHRIVRDREVAAEVAQDAFLAAWTGLARLEQAESFGGWVLRIARNRALNRLERERRSIPVAPVGEETTEMLDGTTDPSDDAGAAVGRSEDAALVWAAAAALGARDASVLDLHLRHGLSPGEIAEELGVTANAAHQVLFRLRNRLGDAVRACVLWRAGHPACAGLTSAVAAAGITSFGAPAVRVISDHALSCRECTGRQEARLAPEALFAALPLLAVSPETLDAIRGGLAEAGVPIAPRTLAQPPSSGAPPSPQAMADRRPALIAVAAGALVLLVAAVLLWGDDDPSPSSEEIAAEGSSTTTSTEPQRASSTTPSSSTSTTASSSTTSSTSAPVGSIPAPTPPPTTGPNPEIGTTSEPGLAPNPPTTATPRPTTTTTTTTTTEPPPAPPRIISFTATRTPGPGCATPSQRIALSWRTADASDVRVVGPGAPTGARPAFGTATGCSPGAAAYTLTATGPGGSVSRTATVP